MNQQLATISLHHLLIGLLPTVIVIVILFRWTKTARTAIYANARMLVQLLAVGYVLTYIFETNNPWLIVALVALMVLISAWISITAFKACGPRDFLYALLAVALPGLLILGMVTQIILDMTRWFEPRYMVPLAGMILANAMNTVSLSGERFMAESQRGVGYPDARRVALEAAMIPQFNALFAVGLVALPGMMTGQILSGVDPLIAVRYQIMVMSMIFGSAGLAAALYLWLLRGDHTEH
ncbi:MAG: ABC transporter permease [Gammaproteobacteria bacterium]|nr:ABC transporter permease [Gammaproteobacteria bacterium]